MIDKIFNPKSTIIALSIVALALAGTLTIQLLQKPVPVSQNSQELNVENGQIVYNPQSETAERYFPGGGNAIDFRNGAQGGFEIKFSKSGEKINLDWDKNFKVTEVKAYDLGDLNNLQDHKLVFNIVNWDIKGFQSSASSTLEQPPLFPQDAFPQPEVYISPSYQIGLIPAGFFDINPYEDSKGKTIFEKESRYSIELYAIDQDGKVLEAYYTFNHE